MAHSHFRRLRDLGRSNPDALHDFPQSVTFGLYDQDEIRSLSACAITSPVSFNALAHPVPGGLYDLRMGPFTDRADQICATCLLTCEHCPGHIGHIELPLPVCNPLFYSTILQTLKLSCVACHKFSVADYVKELFLVRQKLLAQGLIIAAQKASEVGVIHEEDFSQVDDKPRRKAKVDRAATEAVVHKLRDFFDDELVQSKAMITLQDKSTRSVEDLQKQYRKAFLKSQAGGRKRCPHCSAMTFRIVHYKSRFIFEGFKRVGEEEEGVPAAKVKKGSGEKEKTELNAEELKRHFRELWIHDSEVLSYLYPMLRTSTAKYPTDVFFVDVLAVPPPKSRPCQFMGGSLNIHPQSTGLQYVVESVTVMKQVLQLLRGQDLESLSAETKDMIKSIRGVSLELKLDSVWKELQGCVDHVLDKEMKSGSMQKVGWGFKQLIERKEGIFRMHMMGKRVNYAARTVITPDPNICIDEIGLPEVFAKQLTYKVPVTHWNVEELRDMVVNGPDVHPGAVFVENENGYRKVIDPTNKVQREALAKTLLTPGSHGEEATKYVYRHLINGDAMLLNRQPTLHKPSIMSHRARVLKGEKVMRLHYAICKSYNADFDGDEMNAHFPQNEVARAEAYEIANVCKQYLVPKDGTPLQGLIQDHIIAGVKMTIRGRFFNRADYMQHVFSALVDHPGKIKTLPPTIIKPEQLWSGKQIVSTIILNLVPKDKAPPTLLSSAKIKTNEWSKVKARPWTAGGPLPDNKTDDNTTMSESEVIFRQGEFLSGILDKNQYGTTQYSLVHVFFELYGGTYSGKLLSAFSKIFTNFLHTEGFTLGVRDILVTSQANQKREAIMAATKKMGNQMAANGVNLKFEDPSEIDEEELRAKLEQYHRETRVIPKRRLDIDRGFKDKLAPATNDINGACLPRGLIKRFPDNNLQLMVQAGAKGSTVNTMQISCLLGQIELEGKRPPIMISGKSLPSFKAYDTQPRAGGFIDGRFMSGIRPQEFFFHCMAGREGLIDTAVKTSRSGYLQRCLVKLLEGLVVNYDMTVRDSDGSVVQFQYGEDSMDVCKAQYLRSDQLDFLHNNKASILDPKAIDLAQKYTDVDDLDHAKRKMIKWKIKHGAKDYRDSGFLRFCRKRGGEHHELAQIQSKFGRSKLDDFLLDEWRSMSDEERRPYHKKAPICPDPVVHGYRPDSNFGSVTEALDDMIETYLSKKDSTRFDTVQFRDMMYLKAMHAMVEPGEPVGVLAAQSVGEPSTQMTLNTFHFAGRGEMNVTLGIPRLREILMVASANIKTPSMTIPFHSEVSDKQRDALRISLNRVTLKDVLENVHVTESIKLQGKRQRIITLRFEFLPRKAYKDRFLTTPNKILAYFERKFVFKVFMPVMTAIIKDKKITVESGAEAPGSKDKKNDDVERNVDALEREGVGEGHASSDEEDLPDDADATDARKKSRQMDGDHEEGLSEDEELMVKSLANELDDILEDEDPDGDLASKPNSNRSLPTFPTTMDAVDDGFEDMAEESDESMIKTEDLEELNMGKDEAIKRRNYILQQSKPTGLASVVNYSYDTEKELWCQLTLAFDIQRKSMDMSNVVKKAAEKAIIHEVKHISRAFLVKNDKSEPCLTTEGVNIEAMFERDHLLDLKRLACNNIHDMARYYGIESANRTIVSEIVNVFKAYGIVVNPRHLTLIADYMTFDGSYKPFNRIGIENNPSPLQQMTFETAIGFLRHATLSGKTDTLDSPSSCIVVGKPCFGGTSSFKLVQNLMAGVKERSFAAT
ncbi:DNA-directed RNA polymerase I subunit RPA1-like [Tigriopus californicus]|uniref:DNA-directed RNA polymerase I subunit RPA1-like n=1 Tax=Tigriopus californicus TaxID=6832 RepID=UPI0027D9FE9C|nr:DNA-directed RNA polymerase I subunit RPA1-like [Tigriopus californicus]